MAKVMKIIGLLLMETLLMSSVLAQFRAQYLPRGPQIQNAPYSQPQTPLITSLLSRYASNMPFVDKLNTIAAVIQKLPPKNPGVANKRIYMAEALKKTALESLMYAANTCKCSQKAESRVPLPNPQVTVGNDVLANRAANVRYMTGMLNEKFKRL